jgi:hypothetical protein
MFGNFAKIGRAAGASNGQIKLMQQDSRVMCVNGPVRAERVWWPMGEFIDGDPIFDEKGHLRNRRVIIISMTKLDTSQC